jgi:hypothetical protein
MSVLGGGRGRNRTFIKEFADIHPAARGNPARTQTESAFDRKMVPMAAAGTTTMNATVLTVGGPHSRRHVLYRPCWLRGDGFHQLAFDLQNRILNKRRLGPPFQRRPRARAHDLATQIHTVNLII